MSNRIKKRLYLLARGRGERRLVGFFSLLEDKIIWIIKENKYKIMLRKFNCAMDKIASDGGNKIQRLYRCGSNYALAKLVVDNGLQNL